MSLFDKYDDEQVKKLIFEKKEKIRIKAIRAFIFSAKKQDYENIKNVYSRSLVENSFNHLRFLMISSLVINAILYKVFFTGVYSSGNFYFNMNKVPLALKLSITTFLTSYMSFRSWEKHIYSPDFYRIAITNNTNNSKSNFKK